MPTIRLLNAALDEHNGMMVLRGALDMECLDALQVDDYQREVSSTTSLAKIMKGFEEGSAVPDIELGMRGFKKTVRDGVYTLHDPVYIIDGLQRVSAAKLFKQKGGTPHLGACVHFGTTKKWEQEQFRTLNADRTRVNANVLLRNDRERSEAVAMLHKLTTETSGFVLNHRVQWDQKMARGQLFSAMTVAKVACVLHSHKTGVIGANLVASDAHKTLDGVKDCFGINVMRSNVKTFFEILDECFGFKLVKYADKNAAVKPAFMLTVARIFSNHEVFWKGDRLSVETSLQKKLAQFGTHDPAVVQMASGGSKIDPVLNSMIVEHLNSGKRTRRLVPRVAQASLELPTNGGGEEGESEE